MGNVATDVTLLDLKDLPLPHFDNDQIFFDMNFKIIYDAINAADGVVIAAPVYNWALGSTVKQVIEATGATGEGGRKSAWFDKVVSFVCAGGLPHSYTAFSSMANTLMLDFKCIINPYTVYATGKDWSSSDVLSSKVSNRLTKAMVVKTELTTNLARRTYSSDWEI